MNFLSVFVAFLSLVLVDRVIRKSLMTKRIIVGAMPLSNYAKFSSNDKQPRRLDGVEVPPPEILRFMRRFGYLEPLTTSSTNNNNNNNDEAEALYHESAIIEAIKNVQKYGALEQTGILDNETLNLFTKARCGVPDIEGIPYYIAVLGSSPAPEVQRHRHRHRRYVIGAKPWTKRHITYFIANKSFKVPSEQVNRDLKRAFDLWSEFSGLQFVFLNSTAADIILGFGVRYHGDNFPFDGPGNVLAHAYYPYETGSSGGDIHFDEEENWIENSTDLSNGVDFYSVLVHELGHSLGLAHSTSMSSIMFPYYKGQNQIQLDDDDKRAMREMYLNNVLDDDEQNNFIEYIYEGGSATMVTKKPRTSFTIKPETKTRQYSTTTTTTTEALETEPTFEGDYETVAEHKERYGQVGPIHLTTKSLDQNDDDDESKFHPNATIPRPLLDICHGDFDAVTLINGSVHIFKDEYVWKLTSLYTIAEGYPKLIHELFSFLKTAEISRVDAAYLRHDDALILFTGNKYWVSKDSVLLEDSPRPLTDLLGAKAINLTSVDAAMLWPKNNLTYIFTGNKFWRYNDITRTFDAHYPKSMRRWPDIPNNINAAATLANGKTYFFKGNLYWLYNNTYLRSERGYPRRASTAWLKCPVPPRTKLRNFNTTITFISSFVWP